MTPHSITVEWGAPESDGGAPLEGYKVAVRDAKRQMRMEVGRVSAEVQKLKVQDLSVRRLYLLQALFLCNICVVFKPVLAFGNLLFIHALTNETRSQIFPVSFAD